MNRSSDTWDDEAAVRVRDGAEEALRNPNGGEKGSSRAFAEVAFVLWVLEPVGVERELARFSAMRVIR